MKIYFGTISPTGEKSVTVRTLSKRDQQVLSDEPLHHVSYHSPDGFEWGYGGGGPADLALAILSDHLEEEHGRVSQKDIYRPVNGLLHPALKLHQKFKSAFVARFARDEVWVLNSEHIHSWLVGLALAQRAMGGEE